MRNVTRDIVSGVLAAAAAVTVFAKLESYSWWLIGSWKGAVGVLAVLGLGMMLVNLKELLELSDVLDSMVSFLWLITATVIVASLIDTTSKTEFVTSAILIGISWLMQLTQRLWGAGHHHGSHYAPTH